MIQIDTVIFFNIIFWIFLVLFIAYCYFYKYYYRVYIRSLKRYYFRLERNRKFVYGKRPVKKVRKISSWDIVIKKYARTAWEKYLRYGEPN